MSQYHTNLDVVERAGQDPNIRLLQWDGEICEYICTHACRSGMSHMLELEGELSAHLLNRCRKRFLLVAALTVILFAMQ